MRRRLAVSAPLLALLSIATATCGGGGGPATPSGSPPPGALVTPTTFRIVLQRVLFTNNEIQMTWNGSGSTYRVSAGASPNASELLNVEVSGTSYTWNAPRTEGVFYVRVAASQGTATSTAVELPIFTIDLRNVIDALFFGSGPMADTPSTALLNPSVAIWPDGTRVAVRVSAESGDLARANAQTFVDDYASIIGGVITAGVEVIADDMKSIGVGNLPLLTVAIRVLSGFCGGGAIACANIGPAPVGSNRSMVTMNGATGGSSIAHELGHAYGMRHVHRNASVRAELDFMMNPTLVSVQMTEPEKNAIRAARDGGLRAGMTRAQAQAAGLVNPFPSSSPSGLAGFGGSANRGPVRCTIIEGDGSRLWKTRQP